MSGVYSDADLIERLTTSPSTLMPISLPRWERRDWSIKSRRQISTVPDGHLKLFRCAAALAPHETHLRRRRGPFRVRASDDFIADASDDFLDGLAFSGLYNGICCRGLGAAVLAAGAAAGSFLSCLSSSGAASRFQGRADLPGCGFCAPESGQADSGLAGFP
jgi:hypothetical protein